MSFAFFAVLLFLRSPPGISFRERTFVFGGRRWSCVFSVVFCLGFALWLGASLSNMLGKFSSCQVFFFGFILSVLGFCRRRFLLCSLFKIYIYRSSSNRTPPHRTFWSVCFSFSVPPRLVYRPFWPCVLAFLLGCHSGAPRVSQVLFWAFRACQPNWRAVANLPC